MTNRDIQQKTDQAVYYCRFADLLQDRGEYSAAISHYREALTLNPDLLEAYHNLGNSYFKQNRYHQAILCYRKALELDPGCADAHNSIGNSYYEQGRGSDAERAYRQALRLNPELTAAHFNLGNLNFARRKYSAAIASYQSALGIDASLLEAMINLGNAWRALDDDEAALECYRRILAIDPAHADACSNIGNTYYNQENFDDALAWYQKALQLDPRLAEAHFNLGLLYLKTGQFDQGWKHYAWRFQREDWRKYYPYRFDKPIWNGAHFGGRRLFVHAEQGLGDTLQFVRYLPMVKERGGTVIFEADPVLAGILRDFPGVDEFIPRSGGQPYGEFDLYVPLLSLPGIFNTNLENIPDQVPYIFSNPDRTRTWQAQMQNGGFRIGLVWSAKSAQARRSCALKHILPILKVDGVKFYGLQKGAAADQKHELQHGVDLVNLGEEFEDFADTAAAIANLDLVISVDTSVAHLAGAMGTSVWMLLPFPGDWRWLFKREDSPWYPSMKIYRQTTRGNWGDPCKQMASDLESLVSRRNPAEALGAGSDRPGAYRPSGLEPATSNWQGNLDSNCSNPSDCLEEFKQAEKYHRAGALDRAEALYRQILANQPDQPDGLHLLGVLHHQNGNDKSAVRLIEKAIRLNPSNPYYYCNLGVVYRSLEMLEQSVACYHKALEIKPDYGDACNNMANIFRKQGRLKEAAALYQKAIALQPDDAVAYNNLGHVFRELGAVADEIGCYQKALQAVPDCAKTYCNLANAWQYQGEFDRAITCYQKALEKKPDFPEAYNNLGSALITKGRLSEASRCHRQALLLDPHSAEAFNNLGSIHQNQGRIPRAQLDFQRALEIKPDYVKAHSNLLYCLHFDPGLGRKAHLIEATSWWQRHGLKFVSNSLRHPPRGGGRRIRLGFVSPDFREHSVSYFFRPFLECLSRESFEVFSYSAALREDNITREIEVCSDHWRTIAWLSDDTVAAQVRADGIDILVDLAGHTAGNRLPVFARRPAPLQVTWLGYPGTTGMPVMDYRLTDEIADPPGESDQYHSEALVRLAQGFLCYRAPDNAPPVSALPARENGVITFGSFNNLPKINAAVIAVWSRLLRQVTDSGLLLKSRQFADEDVRRRYLGLFGASGVGAERLRLLPRTASTAGHLALYDQVDIALDPFPYNGTTTTCEALWMGVPVISLRGDRHAGRVGASLLTRAGLPNLLAESEAQYVEIGAKLAKDVEGLSRLRTALRARMRASSLCDDKSFAGIMENAFTRMWRNGGHGKNI